MNTQRLSMRDLLNGSTCFADELFTSKDVLGLRPRNSELTSHSHLCLRLTSCSCPEKTEEFTRPWVIPRLEDGLSENEDEEPKIIKDQMWRESLKNYQKAELNHGVLETMDILTLERARKFKENVEEHKDNKCDIIGKLLPALPFNSLSSSESPTRAVAHLDLSNCSKVWGSYFSDTKITLKQSYKIKGLAASMKKLLHSSLQPSESNTFPGVYALDKNIQLGLRLKNPATKELIRNGDLFLQDHKQLKKFKHDPIWPLGFDPLYSTPRHIIHCPESEELWHNPEQVSRGTAVELNDSQDQNKLSRCKHQVFDSRRNSEVSIPHKIPVDWAPSLVFESRFESGNLHQAWRVGQYEYELALSVDMFTNKHTQWYYFRIQNTMTEVTYKFKIINLLKKDSLYNYGMKPLVYSEKDAEEQGVGWFRSGHHIMYKPGNKKGFHKRFPDVQHYCLEFQMEFANKDDTYYLAHCYPYRYTDLNAHLDEIIKDSKHFPYFKREVLCETRAGNSCFLLTITDNTDKSNTEAKLGVVLTARVHPGETQSSWIMKGILDFLISEEPTAKELRQRCIFKIIPMLNPDGVIVGNYRCSLAARDLNRNYQHPKRELFPTVWCTKKMVEELQKDHYILLFSDLHGHSRKPNAFMYGCSQMGTAGPFEVFNHLRQRIFPWLICQRDPERFDWSSCKFHIRKCKESTARVVMYRQLSLKDSFTLEASFSGAIKEQTAVRHFNIKDYLSIGRNFCKGIMDFISLNEDPLKLNEVILNLAYSVTRNQRGKSITTVHSDPRPLTEEDKNQTATGDVCSEKDGETEFTKSDSKSSLIQLDAVKGNFKMNSCNDENNLKELPKQHQAKNFLQLEDKMSQESLQQCWTLLNQTNVSEAFLESETSEDSDCELESEVAFYSKMKKRIQTPSKVKSVLPILSIHHMGKGKAKQMSRVISRNFSPFVNQYVNRSNGGIPTFAQERLMEKAAKRVKEMESAEKLKEQSKSYLLRKKGSCSRTPVRNHTTFCTDHQNNESFTKWPAGQRKEPTCSQLESNYGNIEAAPPLEDTNIIGLTQDKSSNVTQRWQARQVHQRFGGFRRKENTSKIRDYHRSICTKEQPR